MYATVRRYEGVINTSEVVRLVTENFVPMISQVPGFIAYYLVDAGGGIMITTSIFEDKAGVKESNRRAAEWVRENVAPFLPYPPRITAGEVVVHKARD